MTFFALFVCDRGLYDGIIDIRIGYAYVKMGVEGESSTVSANLAIDLYDKEDRVMDQNRLTKNVDAILCAATNLESSRQVQELARNYPFIYAAIGLHPSDLFHIYKKDENYSFFCKPQYHIILFVVYHRFARKTITIMEVIIWHKLRESLVLRKPQ